MGFFGGKKKQAEAPAPVSRQDMPGSARKSVRRVVPKTAGQKPAVSVKPVTAATSKPAAVAASNEVQVEELPPPPAMIADGDQLDLGGDITPTRPSGDKPILDSAPPDFTGSLGGGVRQGPSRTGDAVLLEFLMGKASLLQPEQATAVRNKAQAEDIPIDTAAVQIGIITEEQLVNALTQECWVPHLKVDKYEIRKKALDTVTKDDAQHFGVFPVDKLGSLLTLAMVNPLDAEAIRQLEQKTGLDIKKVVATRGEIAQAIDKYYGGKAVAVESSRSFTNEAGDLKSPTQMLARSAHAAAPAVVEVAAPKPVDIAAEIQDIDDLLGGEEIIQPAIIEPVAIKPEELEVAELIEPAIAGAPEPAVAAPAGSDFFLQDAPKSDTSALSRPTLDTPAAPAAAPRAPRAGRGTEPRQATARITAGQAGSKNVVNLVPVMEEEFKHAITHGKAKVFERWIALQSRNRIVNAVPVEREMESVLGGLYASPRAN